MLVGRGAGLIERRDERVINIQMNDTVDLYLGRSRYQSVLITPSWGKIAMILIRLDRLLTLQVCLTCRIEIFPRLGVII